MTTQMFEVEPGLFVAYAIEGTSGPLVVCVPGMGDTRAEYRFISAELARSGYRVLSLDLRGHGESSVGFMDYSAAAVGRDIAALLGALEERDVRLIGTSMAAAAVIHAAAEVSERVSHVVCIGPFARDLPLSFGVKLTLSLLLRRPWGPSAWSMYYRSLYPVHAPADLDAHRAALRENLAAPGRFEALQAMMRASKAECEAKITAVKAKALVLMGERDPDFPSPQAEAKWLAGALGGRAILIPEAGHYPHAEQAPLVLSHLRSFFAESTVHALSAG